MQCGASETQAETLKNCSSGAPISSSTRFPIPRPMAILLGFKNRCGEKGINCLISVVKKQIVALTLDLNIATK
jgi:hypothetical protein